MANIPPSKKMKNMGVERKPPIGAMQISLIKVVPQNFMKIRLVLKRILGSAGRSTAARFISASTKLRAMIQRYKLLTAKANTMLLSPQVVTALLSVCTRTIETKRNLNLSGFELNYYLKQDNQVEKNN